MSLSITQMDGAGAEVTGVDLRTLKADQFEQVRNAFSEYGLLYFRDQSLTEQDHIAFAERWGPINVNRFFAAHPDYPQIAMVAKDEEQTVNIGGGWHTDHSYDEEPALGSILVARELPPVGGDTKFASMYAAYESLSDGLKKTLEGMRAVHSAKHVFGQAGAHKSAEDTADRIGNADAADVLPDPIHPVVIQHPLSGKKALYVNPGFTLYFEGWSRKDSMPLLAYLYEVGSDDAHVNSFHWEPGSIAFWDNRATWHFANNDYQGHRRIMHRITIDGCALSPSSGA